MIGDRMDTDIIAGIETGLDTALVLSGVSTRAIYQRISISPKTYFKWGRRYCDLIIFEDCDKACSNLVSNAFL